MYHALHHASSNKDNSHNIIRISRRGNHYHELTVMNPITARFASYPLNASPKCPSKSTIQQVFIVSLSRPVSSVVLALVWCLIWLPLTSSLQDSMPSPMRTILGGVTCLVDGVTHDVVGIVEAHSPAIVH